MLPARTWSRITLYALPLIWTGPTQKCMFKVTASLSVLSTSRSFNGIAVAPLRPASLSCAFHCVGKGRVYRQPRVLHFGCKVGSQALVERPQQRLGDQIVVLVLDAVPQVATAEVLNERH